MASKNNAMFWKQVKAVSGGKRAGTSNLITQENGRNKIANTDLEKTQAFKKNMVRGNTNHTGRKQTFL